MHSHNDLLSILAAVKQIDSTYLGCANVLVRTIVEQRYRALLRTRSLAHRRRHTLAHLLGRNVLHVSRDGPHVAEGIEQRP